MASPSFLLSTIGRKAAMAASGILLVGFILAHLAGNLLVFVGAEAINEYGAWLRTLAHGAGIWLLRGGLLAAAVIHVWAAWSLTRLSLAARPQDYHRLAPDASSVASRTMRWGGVTILLFVIYHLMHFTWGNAHPDFIHGDVYHNVVTGLRQVPVSMVYIAANIALGLHLYHGVWSACRTLGLSHPRHTRAAKLAGAGLGLLVAAGNISFPVAVLAGIVQ